MQKLIEQLKDKLHTADAVVIGAGAGFSASAGYEYAGARFQKYFGDFADKYGFEDMYSGGFYPYRALEEHWAYWSRYIYINRYMGPPKPVYDRPNWSRDVRNADVRGSVCPEPDQRPFDLYRW